MSLDYDRDLYRPYRTGRALAADTGRLWMDAIAAHLGRRRARAILDLGSGTGRFSGMLADAFGARVTAVEPSVKMREQAEQHAARPDVVYLSGVADAIPAAAGAFDFAFMSMVIHHVRDRGACARELRRILEPGGLVFIRNTFSGRLDRVPYFEFFPEARAAVEARLPTVDAVRAAFTANDLEFVALDTLEQEIDSSLAAHYDRIKQRALSTFSLITDAQFESGLARMRQAAERETTPTPVLESIDLLVFRRPKN